MADAPEVVPGSITPFSSPAISPAPIAPATRDEKSPGPPYAPNDQTTEAPRAADMSDEKEFLQPEEADEVSPKYAMDAQESPKDSKSPSYTLDKKAAPEADRDNNKYAVEEQDRTTPKYPVEDESSPVGGVKPDNDFAGCRGIDPGGQEDASAVDRRRLDMNEGEDWHAPLFGCCNEGSMSLCCEAAFMPCILAGRRYLRVKNTKASEMTSTNAYCLGCFVFTVPLIPFWWVMGMSTRSEIRHRYGIRGSNKADCMTHCFCAWCALVQEEKELLWQEEQRVGSGLSDGYRRGEQMLYSPAR